MHVHALGQHVVIINSLDVAIDLLDKRSNIYSDRPVMPMVASGNLWDAGIPGRS